LKLREFELALRDASEEQGGARRGGASWGRGRRRSVFFLVVEVRMNEAGVEKTKKKSSFSRCFSFLFPSIELDVTSAVADDVVSVLPEERGARGPARPLRWRSFER
jgi:hypothetical protein